MKLRRYRPARLLAVRQLRRSAAGVVGRVPATGSRSVLEIFPAKYPSQKKAQNITTSANPAAHSRTLLPCVSVCVSMTSTILPTVIPVANRNPVTFFGWY